MGDSFSSYLSSHSIYRVDDFNNNNNERVRRKRILNRFKKRSNFEMMIAAKRRRYWSSVSPVKATFALVATMLLLGTRATLRASAATPDLSGYITGGLGGVVRECLELEPIKGECGSEYSYELGSNFGADLKDWDVSMYGMFAWAQSFEGDGLENWN